MYIFISYRRNDTASTTGRLYDRLIESFGKENVYRDVDNTPLGVDFRDYIKREIYKSDVVLVIIGEKWLDIKDSVTGVRRLDDPLDHVRIEIETALSLSKIVIPVIVDGAAMPREKELPQSLKELSFRNAATVRHDPYFMEDAARLIKAIRNETASKNESEHAIDSLLPEPFDWCHIPGFVATSADKTYTYMEEFYIAKYPITIAQFQAFVNADDGYNRLEWWKFSAAVSDWHNRNPLPVPSRFKGEKRPREMVSWYEAQAFCQWLGYLTNQRITLPTGIQRHRVVAGQENNIFPWGNEFNNTLCNTREFRPKTTTSVDRYPLGASSYGVMDLSGNVWEWNADEKKSESDGSVEYFVYGGGWYSRHRHAHAKYPRTYSPDYRAPDVGFRCIMLNS